MDSRKPIYHKDGHRLRVVSKANVQWTVQERKGDEKGMNATRHTPHDDPWKDISCEMSREEAIGWMYRHMPVIKAVQGQGFSSP